MQQEGLTVELGSVADWVSAVGTVLALFAATTAILLQSRELGLQRAELKATNEEMVKQSRHLQVSVDAQTRLAQVGLAFHYFDQQVVLSTMAIEMPHLRSIFGFSKDALRPLDFAETRYAHIWFRLVNLGYRFGYVSAESLLSDLSEGFFASDHVLLWWRIVEPRWSPDSVDRDFINVVNEAHRRAVLARL